MMKRESESVQEVRDWNWTQEMESEARKGLWLDVSRWSHESR